MEVRIYYEDTDSGGVVYHANYLKYMERARTEFFRTHGFNVAELAADGFVFPVVKIALDFKAPAVHDDILLVSTAPSVITASTIRLQQVVSRQSDGKVLVAGEVTIACINRSMKAIRIPENIRLMINTELERQGNAI